VPVSIIVKACHLPSPTDFHWICGVRQITSFVKVVVIEGSWVEVLLVLYSISLGGKVHKCQMGVTHCMVASHIFMVSLFLIGEFFALLCEA
jgi:hypothetical protein